MRRASRTGFGLLCGVAAVLWAGSWAALAETACDTDPEAVFYQPTVDPNVLNSLLDLLGTIPLDVSAPVEFDGLFNSHNLVVDVSTSIDLSGVAFLVTPTVGSLEVSLQLPGVQDAALVLNIEHEACWAEPYTSCDEQYAGCNTECANTRDQCVSACGLNFTCIAGCLADYAGCTGQCLLDNGECGLCLTENGVLDSIIQDTPATLSFTDASVTQAADVCVSGTCTAIHPLESTVATINGLYLQLFDTSDPTWGSLFQALNDLINGIFLSSSDLQDKIAEFFEDEDGGLLIEVFSQDIGNDGCTPVKEVTDCLAAGCTTVNPTKATTTRSLGVLFYGVPVAVMITLILRRRRK